jgi:dihydromethanopterin reductase (acceptor)
VLAVAQGVKSFTMVKVVTPRWAWALTGSGHFFRECLVAIRTLENVDLFVSKAAGEVLRMYKQDLALPTSARIFRDTTASSPPVGSFYYGVYHTLVLAPATSNTVAKCVYGISDNLATNVFAQAGKCRVPTIVFACDTAPELETEAPKGMVRVYPRRIDLENTCRLKSFDGTEVVESLDELEESLARRKRELAMHG